jgi:uncharacterized membrane protein YGL010W
MLNLHALFADYASHHQTAGNKALHRLGIPLIMLTLIGMLARVPLFTAGGFAVDAAMLLVAVSTLYYLALEWRLALLMLLVSAGFWYAGRILPLWLNLTLFVAGWVLQFVGHSVYEKRRPAFVRNLIHLLIGPLWILNDVVPVVRTPLNVS